MAQELVSVDFCHPITFGAKSGIIGLQNVEILADTEPSPLSAGRNWVTIVSADDSSTIAWETDDAGGSQSGHTFGPNVKTTVVESNICAIAPGL